MSSTHDSLPDDIAALKAALLAERAARRESEARAAGAEAMVAHLKLLIAKLKREQYGASSERGRKLLDQLEMQLEDLETAAAEVEAAIEPALDNGTTVRPFTRAKPVRGPLPDHLPRERIVVTAPTSCPCCGGKLAKLGETITETLESIPRSYKVIQTVREKFSCRACEMITIALAIRLRSSDRRSRSRATRAVPSDRARPRRGQPAGDDRPRQVRRASAAEPPERGLCPRRHRAQRLDAGRLGWGVHGGADAAGGADPRACAGRRAHSWRRQCAAEAHRREGLHDLTFCARKLR